MNAIARRRRAKTARKFAAACYSVGYFCALCLAIPALAFMFVAFGMIAFLLSR